MQYIWIGIIAALVLLVIYLIPKHKQDIEQVKINEQLKQEWNKLTADIASAETENRALERQKVSLNEDIKQISSQATVAANEIYKKSYDLMQERMSQAAEIAGAKYQKAEEEYKKQYLKLVKENAAELAKLIGKITLKQEELADLKSKQAAAIEADKRRILEENQKDFYKIKISEDELWDIKCLKEVVKELKCDPLPVNKVIWEVYYKKPTMDLLGRLTPTGKTYCGIYKITNIHSGQCYIGQSVDIRNRFRDHIKAGLGIGSWNNRFYTEMKTLGPENFMYEILEECSRNKLNERERYWIDFYDSTAWGFNSTQGNKDGELNG